MRKKKEELEIFGMSFLDVISCGFGAIVALLMLAKNLPTPIIIEDTIQDEINNSFQVEMDALITERSSLKTKLLELEKKFDKIDVEIAKKTNTVSSLEDLKKQKSKSVSSIGTMKSDYSGGIPVGPKHIIFVIDTSGSMKQNWGIVVQKVRDIIASHPQVNGLQVLNDMGETLIPGYDKMWIPDSPSARKNFEKSLLNMSAFSNSSPVEGIERALKIYGAKADEMSIYVFGDDFTGKSYDEVLFSINKLNLRHGKKFARIHGIGFPWGQGDRFGTLMRALTQDNNGVYIGF